MKLSRSLLLVILFFLLVQWPVCGFCEDTLSDYDTYDRISVFDDGFDDNQNEWAEVDNENALIELRSGGLFMERRKSTGSSITVNPMEVDSSRDFIIETQVKKVSGINNNGFGLVWGVSDNNLNDYYQFLISGDGHFRIDRWENGKREELAGWTKSSRIKTFDGGVNTLSIVKSGSNLTFFINGRSVKDMKFKSFMGGRFGYLVCQNQAVKFDYFRAAHLREKEYRLVLNEDFSNNRNGWTVADNENGKLTIGPNGFRIKRHKKTGCSLSFKPIDIDPSMDFKIETEVRKISGINNNGFGLAWGASDDNVNDHFQFIISGDGHYRVDKWEGGKEEEYTGWVKSPHIKKDNGSRNTLSFTKVNDTLKFYINGHFVHEVPFKPFIGKRFGFLVYLNQEVEFDYVRAWATPAKKKNQSEFRTVLYDDFESNKNKWPVSDTESARLTVADNTFTIQRHKTSGTSISIRKVPIDEDSDWRIDTKVKKVAGIDNNGHGIAWGASDTNVNDYFYFYISGDGYYCIGKWENHKDHEYAKWTQSSAINEGNGSSNRLSVVKKGDSLKFYINDTYVRQIESKPFMGSRAGFLVCQNQTVAFDYIKYSRGAKGSRNFGPEISVSSPDSDPGDTTMESVKVAGRVKDKDGISQVMVNGRKAKVKDSGAFVAYVPLSMGDNTITIKAVDGKKKSSTKVVHVKRRAKKKPVVAPKGGERLALVIGNADYSGGGGLRNPVNDARVMKTTLEGLGFKVLKYENSDQRTMKKAIDRFGRELKKYSVGLFFYAGHGIQVNGSNYLVPINASLEDENDVEYDTVRADRVLAKMESAGSRTNIIILDACRDNPFERSWSRGARGTGLAFMNAPSGSIIAYATSPGSTASDGTGKNGLYTSAILDHIHTRHITIEQMFKRVRSAIIERSGSRQVPWESTSLQGDFYFNP